MSVPFTETLSSLLQTKWTSAGTGLAVNDIFWSHTQYEAISQLEGITQKAIISVYNPPAPVKSVPQSREFALVDELAIVDILLKPVNYATVEVALQVRETIIMWLQKIIQQNQFIISGQSLVQVEKEVVKAEAQIWIRSAWLVKGSRFQIST
jgi:hypothetical protein